MRRQQRTLIERAFRKLDDGRERSAGEQRAYFAIIIEQLNQHLGRRSGLVFFLQKAEDGEWSFRLQNYTGSVRRYLLGTSVETGLDFDTFRARLRAFCQGVDFGVHLDHGLSAFFFEGVKIPRNGR